MILMFILLHKLLFFARVMLQHTLLYNLTDFLIVGPRAMPKAKHVITILEVWMAFMEHMKGTVVLVKWATGYLQTSLYLISL